MSTSPPSLTSFTQPVGAELAVALEGVGDELLRGLDDSPLIDVIVAAERQIAHLHAVQARAMVELSRRENYAFCGRCGEDDETTPGHDHDPIRAVGSELSAALSWTPTVADQRAALAVELVEDLPDTLTALDEGRVDLRRAGLIVDKTRLLDWPARRQVEQAVLPMAGDKTSTQLGRLLDREVIAADPTSAERRRERGRRDRRVEPPRPCGNADGIADLVLTGPAEDLMALYTAVDAAARAARHTGKPRGDTRTLDQHRFDLITGLGWTALTIGHLGCCNPDCAQECATHPDADPRDAAAPETSADPAAGRGAARRAPRLGTRHRRPAVVQVTVPVTTLTGTDDQPADLDGYGPIPAQAARLITADATIRRLITDPRDGQLLEYGRTTYAPPQALADFVTARDRTCRFPTVTVPGHACDIDHRVPYQRGGTTGKTNNQLLCRRFHIDKTKHHWQLRQTADGTYIWTSPAGRVYRTPPEPIGPITDRRKVNGAEADGPEIEQAHDPPERPPF